MDGSVEVVLRGKVARMPLCPLSRRCSVKRQERLQAIQQELVQLDTNPSTLNARSGQRNWQVIQAAGARTEHEEERLVQTGGRQTKSNRNEGSMASAEHGRHLQSNMLPRKTYADEDRRRLVPLQSHHQSPTLG